LSTSLIVRVSLHLFRLSPVLNERSLSFSRKSRSLPVSAGIDVEAPIFVVRSRHFLGDFVSPSLDRLDVGARNYFFGVAIPPRCESVSASLDFNERLLSLFYGALRWLPVSTTLDIAA